MKKRDFALVILINKLASLENIAKEESSFVMVEVKQETAYNLDD